MKKNIEFPGKATSSLVSSFRCIRLMLNKRIKKANVSKNDRYRCICGMFQCDTVADTFFCCISHVACVERSDRWIENFNVKSTFDLSQCWKFLWELASHRNAVEGNHFVHFVKISMMILYCTTKMDIRVLFFSLVGFSCSVWRSSVQSQQRTLHKITFFAFFVFLTLGRGIKLQEGEIHTDKKKQ